MLLAPVALVNHSCVLILLTVREFLADNQRIGNPKRVVCRNLKGIAIFVKIGEIDLFRIFRVDVCLRNRERILPVYFQDTLFRRFHAGGVKQYCRNRVSTCFKAPGCHIIDKRIIGSNLCRLTSRIFIFNFKAYLIAYRKRIFFIVDFFSVNRGNLPQCLSADRSNCRFRFFLRGIIIDSSNILSRSAAVLIRNGNGYLRGFFYLHRSDITAVLKLPSDSCRTGGGVCAQDKIRA